MEKKNDAFEYTYSAKQQEELEKIKRKYMPKEEDKMEQLRKLDRDVTQPGTIWSILIGIIGCLLLGIGMCCTMVWADRFFIPGIVIGVIGLAVVGLAYPVYVRVTEKQREKLAPQILALVEELSK